MTHVLSEHAVSELLRLSSAIALSPDMRVEDADFFVGTAKEMGLAGARYDFLIDNNRFSRFLKSTGYEPEWQRDYVNKMQSIALSI